MHLHENRHLKRGGVAGTRGRARGAGSVSAARQSAWRLVGYRHEKSRPEAAWEVTGLCLGGELVRAEADQIHAQPVVQLQ